MDMKTDFDLSALSIEIPNAGKIIQRYRGQYTTDGALGMPPHITLLYPFLSNTEYDQQTSSRLADVISKIQPFSIEFGGLGRFPGALYLNVREEEKIRELIRKLLYVFPEFPPYGGKFSVDELTPHITVAVDTSTEKLDSVEQNFKEEYQLSNVQSVLVERIMFSVRTSDGWIQYRSFELGNT
jgi:2'-5' RNA ligase